MLSISHNCPHTASALSLTRIAMSGTQLTHHVTRPVPVHCVQDSYEAIDGATGEPGPRRARLNGGELFAGFVFCCVGPFRDVTMDQLEVRVGGCEREGRAADGVCGTGLSG